MHYLLTEKQTFHLRVVYSIIDAVIIFPSSNISPSSDFHLYEIILNVSWSASAVELIFGMFGLFIIISS